ncbi:hypothetical protein [Motilimonas pumila]|uniref:hypothetical protein n=1 Tax=Motilimonas pumila TaxID=2303987 RepID=UPI0011C438A0|nr:hypothetical protein [Motilimonas pumila]
MKILKSILRLIVSVLVFVSLFYLSFLVAPYLLTSEKYVGEQGVSKFFPVAQKVNNSYSVIQWEEYKNREDVYLVDEEELVTRLINNERIELEKSKDGLINLTYYADNYTFWSGYYIVNGKVEPVYFRFVGAFIVIPVFGVVLIIYLFGRLFYARYVARKRMQSM